LDDVKVIKIINNFFNEDVLNKIQKHITTNIYYTPRWFEGQEQTKENYYGDRFYFTNDSELKKTFIKQAENKFKIKIKDINPRSGIDLRNIDNFKPHEDTKLAKINILIMLYGPIAVTNGTVFYSDNELDIHVGFRPNRAVLFPSDWTHSPHASEKKGIRRYTSTIFVRDYEDV
jgi:hypothetical protein